MRARGPGADGPPRWRRCYVMAGAAPSVARARRRKHFLRPECRSFKVAAALSVGGSFFVTLADVRRACFPHSTAASSTGVRRYGGRFAPPTPPGSRCGAMWSVRHSRTGRSFAVPELFSPPIHTPLSFSLSCYLCTFTIVLPPGVQRGDSMSSRSIVVGARRSTERTRARRNSELPAGREPGFTRITARGAPGRTDTDRCTVVYVCRK